MLPNHSYYVLSHKRMSVFLQGISSLPGHKFHALLRNRAVVPCDVRNGGSECVQLLFLEHRFRPNDCTSACLRFVAPSINRLSYVRGTICRRQSRKKGDEDVKDSNLPGEVHDAADGLLYYHPLLSHFCFREVDGAPGHLESPLSFEDTRSMV